MAINLRTVGANAIAIVTVLIFLMLLILAFQPWALESNITYNYTWSQPVLVLGALGTVTLGRWLQELVLKTHNVKI